MKQPHIRIVHVAPAITIGGLWRHLQIAQWTAQETSILSLFEINDPKAVACLPLTVQCLDIPITLIRDQKAITARIEEVLRELRPTLLHSYHYFADIYAIRAAHRLGVPVVRSVLGITQASPEDPFGRTRVLQDWSEQAIEHELQLEPLVTRTVTVSHELRRKLIRYGFPPRKIEAVHSGIDTDYYRATASTDRNRRNNGAIVIGFLGRLEAIKNPLAVIEIAHRLKQSGCNVEFLIVGEGRLEADVRERIHSFGLDGDVTMRPATYDVLPTLNVIDVLLIPSLSEGIPWTILEAMAMGKVVVASRVGGIPEVIKDTENGYLLNADDIDGMARRIALLAEQIEVRTALGAAARRTVTQHFSLADHVKSMKSAYASCGGALRETVNSSE